MKNTLWIHKVAGARKNAIRVNFEDNIPEFLKETISIVDNQVHLVCVEGNEVCPLGSVIGYEESETTGTGWNAWHIANAATSLIEKDGFFYKKAISYRSAPMEAGVIPEFALGAKITENPDSSFSLETSWGTVTGFPGKAYWILYGTNSDGSPDVNILTKSEKSYHEYIVCSETGEDIGKLDEIDP